LAGGINAALDGTKAVLDSVVGSYALYQFPLVWQQLTERHSHAFVDFSEKVTTRSFFSMRSDNFIAFRLNASSYVVEDRTFLDPLHKQVAALGAAKLIEPLVFLKDSLGTRTFAPGFCFSSGSSSTSPRSAQKICLLTKRTGRLWLLSRR
jgi:hypothetical protein